MKFRKIPFTDIQVSEICLGTMTFGKQNTESGHQQLDYAIEEELISLIQLNCIQFLLKLKLMEKLKKLLEHGLKNNNRSSIILASKIAGPGAYTKHITSSGFSKSALNEALNDSLKRLQTDYIDLYQLHLVERFTNTFGIRGYKHISKEQWKDNFSEILFNLNEHIKEGKIRHIGISNENPWGVMCSGRI